MGKYKYINIWNKIMPANVSRLLYWTPRIIGILFILFLAVFSLDVFEPGRSAGEIALGLFMHNIPVFILTAALIIAWKREIIGTYVFGIAGLLYIALTVFARMRSDLPWYLVLSWSLQIAGPAFIIAWLFYLNWKKRKAIVKDGGAKKSQHKKKK